MSQQQTPPQSSQHIIESSTQLDQHVLLGHPSVPIIPQCMQPTPQATFIDPSQYIAAIPMQPVISAGFPATAAVISSLQPLPELLHPGIVMTSTQTHIQEQLQRKHEELQQLIVQQQEELRRVSEQLLIARYSLMPSIVVPFNAMGRAQSRSSIHGNITSTVISNHSTSQIDSQSSNSCNIPLENIDNQTNIHRQSNEIVSYMELSTAQSVQNIENELVSSSASNHHEQLHQSPHDHRSHQPSSSQAHLHPEIQIHQTISHMHSLDDSPSNIHNDGRQRSHVRPLESDVMSDSNRSDLDMMSYQMVEESPSGYFTTSNL